jgi:hypothetical protein
VAVDARSADVVVAVLGERRPPIALQLSGLTAAGHADDLGIPRVLLGNGPGEVLVAGSPPSAPSSLATVARPGWAAAVGRLFGAGPATELRHDGTSVRVDRRCSSAEPRRGTGLVGVTGIAIGTPTRLVVPCGAIVAAPLAQGGSPRRRSGSPYVPRNGLPMVRRRICAAGSRRGSSGWPPWGWPVSPRSGSAPAPLHAGRVRPSSRNAHPATRLLARASRSSASPMSVAHEHGSETAHEGP